MISIPTLVNCDVVSHTWFRLMWVRMSCLSKTRFTASEHCDSVPWYNVLRLEVTKTLNSGYLGSRNDEERSEMRYVV